jgi:hypothetical protein
MRCGGCSTTPTPGPRVGSARAPRHATMQAWGGRWRPLNPSHPPTDPPPTPHPPPPTPHPPPPTPTPTQVGPGKVIAGIMKRIDKKAEITNVEA